MWQNSTNGNQEAGPIQEDISFLLPGGELRGRNSLGDLCRDIARGPREAPTEHLGGGGSLTVPWEAAAGTDAVLCLAFHPPPPHCLKLAALGLPFLSLSS